MRLCVYVCVICTYLCGVSMYSCKEVSMYLCEYRAQKSSLPQSYSTLFFERGSLSELGSHQFGLSAYQLVESAWPMGYKNLPSPSSMEITDMQYSVISDLYLVLKIVTWVTIFVGQTLYLLSHLSNPTEEQFIKLSILTQYNARRIQLDATCGRITVE